MQRPERNRTKNQQIESAGKKLSLVGQETPLS
jgi:hypothetical protein